MRNFQRIASGVDVGPLLLALSQRPLLWNEHKLRTTYPDSPHAQVDDIWLRFNEFAEDKPQTVIDDYEVVSYPAWTGLPQARPIVMSLLARVEGCRLGRVMISRLGPGCTIGKHSDNGGYADYYKRYHVLLQSLPGCVFWSGDEQVQMATGEVWWFDAGQPHEVVNNSADDRISMIVDIRSI